MIPDKSKISIDDNEQKIKAFIDDLIITPRKALLSWSDITNQTPAAKIGYLGQHLASLITGVRGTGSGARGDALEDGTEVKSCNKVDQVDKCKDCGKRVMRHEVICPHCGSYDIDRKDDSKWLFTIRDDHEFDQCLNLDRVLLILMDYPEFDAGDYSDIRISAFEIYPKEERMKVFAELITNYYRNIYRKKADNGEKTNPMNLHPFSFQFYKCNPIPVFEALVKDVDVNPKVIINKLVPPCVERGADMETVPMPSCLLRSKEWICLLDNLDFDSEIKPSLTQDVTFKDFKKMKPKAKSMVMPFLNEKQRGVIPLREVVPVRQKKHYSRS